jgi:hypothetical protein
VSLDPHVRQVQASYSSLEVKKSQPYSFDAAIVAL